MVKHNKKTILVTGGAGFVGSHLCEKYLDKGHNVIALDNLQTTFTAHNIEHLMKRGGFKFIKQDVIDPVDFKEKIDWIFHFACPAQLVNLQWDPVHTLKTSVHGTINMLELARAHNARIMLASTSEIYGHKPRNPQKESDPGEVNALGPRACYDEGKRVAETLMMDYYRQYGVDIKIIRIFNTYGPRMYIRDGRVMSNFIVPALAGEPLPVRGDGSHTRSFQYITDLVAGIDKMMNKDGFTGPVNLGNPHEITIKELAEIIIKLTGSKSEIQYQPATLDDPIRRQPDIGLAKSELNWEPAVPLEDGIKETVNYFKSVQLPDKKVLVFTTTYYPDMGPAETALFELAREMGNTEFHIITTKSRKTLPGYEQRENCHIYRLGSGNILGKYLFPLRGAFKARELDRKHHFRFAWSVMASYGGLAAVLFKLMYPGINFLLSYDKTEEEKRGRVKARLFFPIFRLIFKQADSVHVSDITLEKRAKLYNPNLDISVMDSAGKGFVDQIQVTYNHLLNKQEKKLDKPI